MMSEEVLKSRTCLILHNVNWFKVNENRKRKLNTYVIFWESHCERDDIGIDKNYIDNIYMRQKYLIILYIQIILFSTNSNV